MKHILHVVGARPNFMKVAPVFSALSRYEEIKQTLVHTGQHYDVNMSDVFFKQLAIPEPDVNLSVSNGSHAVQTAEVMIRFEPVLINHKPDLVLVYGDVNSTLATALVCAKLCIPIGHVEAGLRSFDKTMPEEINRLLTDHLSDLLFTHSEDNYTNLRREGISTAKMFRVGNVMIDSLIRFMPLTTQNKPSSNYALVTLHRPSNVDSSQVLKRILMSLTKINEKLPIIFLVHPRTKKRIAEFSLNTSQLQLLNPLPYTEFLTLQKHATVIITDSGGVQEESTYLRVPCLTVRDTTERPITVSMGTNTLVGQDDKKLYQEVEKILDGKAKKGSIPPLWDGHASERIAKIISGIY